MKKRKLNWKYALGEIIIVSIGILIAFSINTWSTSLSKNNARKEYKASLVADLNQNIVNLDRIIASQESKVKNLNNAIDQITSGSYELEAVAEVLFQERKSPTFFPIKGTFKSLVAHGDIELFDTDVKRELFDLYDTRYERAVYNGNLYDETYVDIYDAEIRNIMNLRTRKIDNLEHLQSRDFIKNMTFIIDEAQSYIKLANYSKDESEKMLELLRK